jgi:hypothetical protein
MRLLIVFYRCTYGQLRELAFKEQRADTKKKAREDDKRKRSLKMVFLRGHSVLLFTGGLLWITDLKKYDSPVAVNLRG